MLDKVWEVKPCPCTPPVPETASPDWKCGYSIIPGVVTYQGVLKITVAQHIVNLHNRWLDTVTTQV